MEVSEGKRRLGAGVVKGNSLEVLRSKLSIESDGEWKRSPFLMDRTAWTKVESCTG